MPDSDLTAIATQLAVLSNHPYVRGGLMVLEAYGALEGQDFQRRVLRELGAIRERMADIDRKVEQILAIVQRLPELIKRLLSENEKEAILAEIRSKRGTAEDILAYYAPGASLEGSPISPQHRAELRAMALSTIERSCQLHGWGEDSHIGIAYGYGVYLMITRAINESPTLPEASRKRVAGLIEETRSRLAAEHDRLAAAWRGGQEELRDVDRVHRRLIFGSEGWYQHFGTLAGDSTAGFYWAEADMEPHGAPRGYVWLQDAAVWWHQVHYARGYSYSKQEALDLIHAEVRRRRKPQPSEELVALLASADALRRAVEIA